MGFMQRLASRIPILGGSAVTPYNKNSPTIGLEFGNTGLWNAGNLGLVNPDTVDCTLTRKPIYSYDGSVLSTTLRGGTLNTVAGYPEWVYGNADTWNNIPLTPLTVAAMSTFWSYHKWSYQGDLEQFNLLIETMLTDVAVVLGNDGVKKLELAVMLSMPETTKQYIWNAGQGSAQWLGGYVDQFGRAWTAIFKSLQGSSTLGYCIFFPSDMETRFETEFDFAAMAKFAIPKITNASTAWFINGLKNGYEPFGSSGNNKIRRLRWERGFNNSPYANPGTLKESIWPNPRLKSNYSLSVTSGITAPGDGTLTFNNAAQFNNIWALAPAANGVQYTFKFDIEGLTLGSVRVDLATNAGSSVVSSGNFSANGTGQTAQLTGTGTTASARFTATGASGTTCKIRNITITPS